MNLFGMLPKKRGALAGMVQPNLMQMLQPQETPTSSGEMQAPPMGATNVPGFPGGIRPSPLDAKDYPNFRGTTSPGEPPPVRAERGDSPIDRAAASLKENAGPLAWRAATVGGSPAAALGLVGGKLIDMISEPPKQKKATPSPPSTSEATPPTSPQPDDGPPVIGESAMDSVGSSEGFLGSAIGATQEMMQKYGKDAQTLEGAKQALRNEFQDTPELDEIIAKTEQELAQTRANRKQPGLGDFLVMALLNLGGMNPRQSADMVLGLGEQQQSEMRLEDRLAQLEGSRAGAKMQGRRAYRGMEQENRYKALDQMMRQQETSRKQFNEDREFGLKQQGQTSGLLRALAGQESQILGGSLNEADRKAAASSRTKLKKLLGLDDAGLDRMLQQQQQAPKDDRQSRMFGDLVAGGGYA